MWFIYRYRPEVEMGLSALRIVMHSSLVVKDQPYLQGFQLLKTQD